MKKDILELIHFIVWHATENEIKLTRLRLVKFLYLADLYYARENDGQTFTDLPWAFVYYGPYCTEVLSEINNAVKRDLIKEEVYDSQYADKDYYLYRSISEEEPRLSRKLPTYMVSELKWAIKEWGEDTSRLLDYVYFETEPMVNVHRGDKLDFSNAQKPIKQVEIKMKQLSSKKLHLAREVLKKLCDKSIAAEKTRAYGDKPRIYDKSYFTFLSSIEEPDIDTGLTGKAELKG